MPRRGEPTYAQQPGAISDDRVERVFHGEARDARETNVRSRLDRVIPSNPGDIVHQVMCRHDPAQAPGLGRQVAQKSERHLGSLLQAGRLLRDAGVAPAEGVRQIGLRHPIIAQGKSLRVNEGEKVGRLAGKLRRASPDVVLQIPAPEERVFARAVNIEVAAKDRAPMLQSEVDRLASTHSSRS